MFEQDVFQGPGTGTFTSHTFEILFMLLVAFLLGLWLGWVLWSRYRQAAERLRVENESLNITTTTLRGENEKLKKQLADAETERSTLDNQLQNQKLEYENTRNQLTVLESDMEKILQRNRQLETELGFAQSANTSPESGNTEPSEETAPLPEEAPAEDLPDLEAVAADTAQQPEDNTDIPEAGTTMVVLEPEQDTIPAEEDKAETAEPVQTEQVAPIPPAEDNAEEQKSAKEKTAKKPKAKSDAKSGKGDEPVVAAVIAGPKDDLKIVEGIGPKIEELLFKAGITSYGQLAATGVQQLKSILDDAGPRFAMHDPGTWSAQALLAANGEWDNLKAYQDFLNAGKRPDK